MSMNYELHYRGLLYFWWWCRTCSDKWNSFPSEMQKLIVSNPQMYWSIARIITNLQYLKRINEEVK